MRMRLVPTLPGLHFISFLSVFLNPSCSPSAPSSPSPAVTGLGLYSWIQSERFRGSLSRRGEAAVSGTSSLMSQSRRLIELKALGFSSVGANTDTFMFLAMITNPTAVGTARPGLSLRSCALG